MAIGAFRNWLLAPLAALAMSASAQVPTQEVGEPARVMVLGTVHLRYMPETFDPKVLEGLLDRLQAFSPEIITVEQQSGEECDSVRRFASKYGDGFNCYDTSLAKAATKLDIPQAVAEAEAQLKAWPERPSGAQRRNLAALFLAAGDRASAYVQWLQMAKDERRAGDGLSAELVQELERISKQNDESLQLAAVLAARLGLQRVHATDNHTGDLYPDGDAPAKALRDAWSAPSPGAAEREAQIAELKKSNDLLPLYRFINDAKNMGADAGSGVEAAMRHKSPERYPEIWVAGWEVRNLRMVANVRETFRARPGARVLSIVGSAHKPIFDDWLGRMQGTRIVDVLEVLK